MIILSWSQFERNQLAKDISFESFCYQIAYIKYNTYGYFENYFNTPGSEFYLKLIKDCDELNLKSGDEIGWQVKWWYDTEENTSLKKTRREELIQGFKTTLSRHPNIKLWIICTPGNFVEDKYIELKEDLTLSNDSTSFVHWNKNSFQNFLSNDLEKFSSLFNHYFNTNFIGFNFIRSYSQKKLEILKKKFDTDLYVSTKYDEEIFSLIEYEKLYEQIDIQLKYLKDEVIEIENNPSFNYKKYKSFETNYIETAQTLLQECVSVANEVITEVEKRLDFNTALGLQHYLLNFLDSYKSKAKVLDKSLKSKSHIVDDKNWEEENIHDNYLLPSIIALRDYLISHKEDYISILDLLSDLFKKNINVLSSAGYGKTNIACNICNVCLGKNIPSLILLGSSFRKPESPQRIILEQLEIDRSYSFKDFLQAIDTLGYVKRVKVPIIIDGLNESVPYDLIWRGNLEEIINEVSRYENIILITTCRDRYIEAIFDESDIEKIPERKLLVGFEEKSKSLAINKYFSKYKITPLSGNFNKDIFKNPLLLKIFSEVNFGKTLNITLENIFVSIEDYLDQILEKVSKVNSSVDFIVKSRMNSGITSFCKTLWEKNLRELNQLEFHNIIDPNSSSMIGSLTEKLLDEGLCFQKNFGVEDETVQFTYDLIAGFSIAKRVLMNQVSDSETLIENFNRLKFKEIIVELDHPFRQDILMSLIYLIPKKINKDLFEIFNDQVIIEECFNNIDYFIEKKNSQEKIIQYLESSDKKERSFKLLFEKLFENIYKKDVEGLGDFAIRVIKTLNQIEIDIYWSELLRKNFSFVSKKLEDINKRYQKNPQFNSEIDFHISLLVTSSSDNYLRGLATHNLFLIFKRSPTQIVFFSQIIIKYPDINSIESVVCGICGVVLEQRNRNLTLECLNFFIKDLIPNLKSLQINIIDYMLTVSEYALKEFKIDYSNEFIFDINNFNKVLDKETKSILSKKGNLYFPTLFGVDLYEFNKYQISSISSDNYYKRKTFSSIDCLSLIANNMKEKGFKESLFKEIYDDFIDDRKYKYGRNGGSKKLFFYTEKYIWQSYFELVGYLSLTDKLKSDSSVRFRCEYVFFDPSFPKLPKRFQLISECFCPPNDEDKPNWVLSLKDDFIDKYLVHKLYSDENWVLLNASVNQKGENNTRFNLTIESFLIPNKRISKFRNEYFSGNYHNNSSRFYDLYAGEINWSDRIASYELGYYEEQYELFNTQFDYTWSGYTENRFENPYFKFLNPKLSKNLIFKPNGISFFDLDNNQITKMVWTEDNVLYYIKKEFLDKMLSDSGLEFIWTQFVSKYGDFGVHDSKLNPSYKDLRKIIDYKAVVK